MSRDMHACMYKENDQDVFRTLICNVVDYFGYPIQLQVFV
jgi:hypothetical protein